MKKILWTLAVITIAALSCTKQENGVETNPVSDGPDDVTYLKINSVTTSELVKSAIKDTKFPTELPAGIGLFVVGDGYTDAKYCNIKCTKPAGSDEFNTPLIELKEDKATVYAYYPYDANIETLDDLKAISVASSVGGDDWMWTTPVTEVSTAKPAIDLTFNHALALVEITFNISGPEGTMTNVTVAGGTGAFSEAGTMNAIDGAITPDAEKQATKTSPLSQDVNLQVSEGKIIADCLLVPGKTGTDADARQDFYIKCTYNDKTYSASLTGENGVIVRKNTKSTIVLNIKDNKLEVVSVGVSSWGDTNVSGSTATVGGHTVTFNCPEGLKYELYTESVSTALPDEETDAGAAKTVILRYDKASIPEKRFFFLSEPSGCTFTFDEQSGIITVKDVTKDVTVNLGFGTYIPYTAAAKVEPNNKSAFGFPYDETRSTFSTDSKSGVIAIDGIVTSIGYKAFYNDQQLTGITIPEGVTSIGESAFDTCRKLIDVDFSNCSELTTIGKHAFSFAGSEPTYDFQTLNLVLPESLENLGDFALSNSGLKSLTLPANLKTVGMYAVQISEKLETLVIEDGAVIGKGMFRGCTSLSTITLKSGTPPSIIQDGEKAFCELLNTSSTLTNIKTVYVPGTSVDTYKGADGWSEFSDKITAIPVQD